MAEEKKRGPGRPPGSKNKKKEQINEAPKDKHEKIAEMQQKRHADKRVMDEIWGVTLLAIGIFLIFTTQLNTTGAFGIAIHNVLKGLFGMMAVVLPYYFVLCAFCLFFKKMQHINGRTTFFSSLIYVSICILNSSRFINEAALQFSPKDMLFYYLDGVDGKNGGAIGMELGNILAKLIGMPGLYIFCIASIIVSLLLVVNSPVSEGITKFLEKREAKKLLKEMERVESAQASSGSGNEALLLDDPFDEEEDKPAKRGLFGLFKSDDDVIVPGKKKPLISSQELNKEDSNTALLEGPKASKAKPIDPVKDQKNKVRIMGYVADDEIFGSDKPSEGTGLGKSEVKSNGIVSYGLDGVTSTPAGSYGLDGYFPESMTKVSTGINDAASSIAKAEVKAETKPRAKVNKPAIKTYNPEPFEPDAGKSATSHIDDYADLAAAATALNKEEKVDNRPKKADMDNLNKEIEEGNAIAEKPYEFPPIDLLKKPKNSQSMMSNVQLEQRAELLEKTLSDFHVDAKVLAVTQGSSVTRYEVQPATGVKVSSITKLADDIALNLRAKSIRIEAPIPGKAAVGIEVENEKPAPVLARELIESDEFQNAKSKISFVVGKDISGHNIVADLKAMPHILIAGATGSGKSVCINTIITSILYKATPEEVRLILIDPKVVELGHYNGIPHMMIPVVTDPKKAAAALIWAVNEMTQRYKKFAEVGVKELESYNELMVANQEPEKKMPQIVIIIDELADLMMASPSQVEESICRLAQLARAAGMHLVVATQRPSVDIVTGLIKANIPSRIAFCVSSQFDSRTILDVGGAEKLLGKGDMLFSPVGKKPFRVQGPFISDGETAKIIDFVKNQGEANYNDEVSKAIDSPETGAGGGSASDELTEDAIAFILKSQKASVSMLQRRFRIGYNRAARIIDEIEERGIISPQDGSSPRQVLYTEDEYYSAKDVSDE